MGMEITVGSRVSARGLAWEVTEISLLGAQTMLHLRCAAGDMIGLEWDILHPTESVELLRTDLRPDAAGSLAAWRLHHQACLLDQIPGPSDLLITEPGRVQIEPYQLVPLMRALELPRPRLLLADGVGLGKTVEAALIICELIARRRAHRVLIVTPAGPLLVQWVQELRQRFGLRFVPITDAAGLQEQRRKLELGGNPFDAIALCLTSLDFAKQERVLEELERSAWDLAIIDEAHHCASATVGGDREDTQRRRLAEVVARRSDGLLLLTATPHDGYDPHFASLIELLDPSLVDGRGGMAGSSYRRHVVRRLKSHIRNPLTGAPMFRERRVIPVQVELGSPTRPVGRFHQALAALIAPRLRRGTRTRDHVDALAFVSLLKRSGSTIGACVNTLRVVADRYAQAAPNVVDAAALQKERARSLRAYRKRVVKFGVLDADAEGDVAELEADSMAADLHDFGAPEIASPAPSRRRGTDATADALDALIRLGEQAAPHDPKLAALVHEVCAIRAASPAANILIYTEYADSQLMVVFALRDAPAIQGEVLAINGLDAERARTRIAERFSEEDGIILVCTDSLAEGLNLQQRCCNLIHLDLPYNPNRLEQRNGRIDRYGQVNEPQIRYLYLAGTFEERLLLRLIGKYEKARAKLEFMPETLGVTADEPAWSTGLVAGFAERQAMLFDDEPTTIRTLDHAVQEENSNAYRDLLREIDRAFAGFDRSAVRHGWLTDQGSNADAARAAIAQATRLRGDAQLGGFDLPDFVAAAITAETGHAGGETRTLRLPVDWLGGCDGLPGFGGGDRVLRFTRNRGRLRDKQGRSLAFLGRAHPVVCQAVSRALRVDGTECDNRVSAARWRDGTGLAVLLIFNAELRSASRIELQRMIGVLLPECGAPIALDRPDQWLPLTDTEHALVPEGIWQRLFSTWVPTRRPEGDAAASVVMQRAVALTTTEHQQRTQRETNDQRQWLRGRADDICGAFVPRTGDLFGAVTPGQDWLSLSGPLDRLSAFASDGSNPPTQRREANSAVELFQRRDTERNTNALSSPATLRLSGMLMLVPPAFAT